MPDRTVETVEMCASLHGPKTMSVGAYVQEGLFSERMGATCSCPAFKFAKGGLFDKTCKHIQEAEKSVCGWHGRFDPPPKVSGTCPRCGGETVTVRVAA